METIKQFLLSAEVFCLVFSFLQTIAPNKTERSKFLATVSLILGSVCAIVGFIMMAVKWIGDPCDLLLLLFSSTTIVYALIYACKKKEHTKLKK